MAIDSMEHERTAADMNRIPKAGWHLAAKNGPICFSPLSISEDVLAEVRNCREVRQANREVCRRKLPDRREHGLQGRISPMQRLPVNWGIDYISAPQFQAALICCDL
jgi:hypothetical protein